MIQSGGILGELLVALPYAALKAGTQVKRAAELNKDATSYFFKKGIDLKKILLSEGSGITLTNNEIKDNLKVIKSLKIQKFY